MVNLDEKKVRELLKLIQHPEDRKAVKQLLRELQKKEAGNNTQDDSKKRGQAKKALDLIVRAGLEIGKHELITELLHLFD